MPRTSHSREVKEQAVQRVLSGERIGGQVARELGVSRQAVSLWVQQWKKHGGKLPTPGKRGRPRLRLLPEDQLDQLREWVSTKTPDDFNLGKGGEKWSLRSVRELVYQRFKIRYSPRFIDEHLRDWGLARPSEQYFALDSDPAARAESKYYQLQEDNEAQDPILAPKRGRPRKRAAVEEDEDELLIDYQEGISEAHRIMERSSVGKSPKHGVRTGKHSKQRMPKRRKSGRKKRKK